MYLISLWLSSPVLIKVSASVISWPWANPYSRERARLSMAVTESFHSTKEKDHASVLFFYGHYIFLPEDSGKFPKGKKEGDRNTI